MRTFKLLAIVGLPLAVNAAVLAYSPWIGVGLAAATLACAVAAALRYYGIADPHWPLVVVGALLPLNGMRPVESVAYGDIALALAGGVALFGARKAKPPVLLVIVFMGTMLVTVAGTFGIIAEQDWGAWVEAGKFILGAPTVILIVALINPTRNTAILLLTSYAVGACISSISGVFQPVDPAFGRASGLGAHIGHLALAGQLGLFVFVAWFLTVRHLVAKTVAVLGAAICLYGLLISGTRSGLLATFVALALVALANRARGVAVLVGAGTVAIGSFFLILPALPNSENVNRSLGLSTTSTSTSLSNSAHADAARIAFEAIGNHPILGSGFSEGLVAHNLELQIASVGGVLGLIGFLVIWLPIGLTVAQRVIAPQTREAAFATCTGCALLAYFLFAQFEPLIWDRHLWFFIVLTIYLQNPFNRPIDADAESTGTTKDRRQWAAVHSRRQRLSPAGVG